jgi:hypothetical protein
MELCCTSPCYDVVRKEGVPYPQRTRTADLDFPDGILESIRDYHEDKASWEGVNENEVLATRRTVTVASNVAETWVTMERAASL